MSKRIEMHMRAARRTALAAVVAVLAAGSAHAAGEAVDVPHQKWTFGGFKGHFDRAQLQRGFQVYKEVCASCHGLNRIYFRNLTEPGGPQFPEAAVKAMAAQDYKLNDVPNESGKVLKRPAKLSDAFPPPYANEQEARATHGGALPPDLSLIVKARGVHPDDAFWKAPVRWIKEVATGYQEGGADYLYALLTGYDKPPATFKPAADNMSYNKYFPGHQIAMPNPFLGGPTKYQDGTPATVEQNARDVSAFLAWAADPRLEERKRMGWYVLIYILIMTVLLGLAKRRIWSKVAH